MIRKGLVDRCGWWSSKTEVKMEDFVHRLEYFLALSAFGQVAKLHFMERGKTHTQIYKRYNTYQSRLESRVQMDVG